MEKSYLISEGFLNCHVCSSKNNFVNSKISHCKWAKQQQQQQLNNFLLLKVNIQCLHFILLFAWMTFQYCSNDQKKYKKYRGDFIKIHTMFLTILNDSKHLKLWLKKQMIRKSTQFFFYCLMKVSDLQEVI